MTKNKDEKEFLRLHHANLVLNKEWTFTGREIMALTKSTVECMKKEYADLNVPTNKDWQTMTHGMLMALYKIQEEEK